MDNRQIKQAGFTLVELLMAMVVAGVVVAGTTLVFRTMVRQHNTEARNVTMQQNLRATMGYIERYIRMAGYDPTGSAGAGFTTILSNDIAFTMDKGALVGGAVNNKPNGKIDNHWDEKVEFKSDANNRLVRVDSSGTSQLLAEDIEVVNFVYLDRAGMPTTNASDVRTVQVSIVARSGDAAGFTTAQRDNTTYRNMQGAVILPAPNDNIRRIQLAANISCRNTRW